MAGLMGFEPTTLSLGVRCAIRTALQAQRKTNGNIFKSLFIKEKKKIN